MAPTDQIIEIDTGKISGVARHYGMFVYKGAFPMPKRPSAIFAGRPCKRSRAGERGLSVLQCVDPG
jgi:hypothetical protein